MSWEDFDFEFELGRRMAGCWGRVLRQVWLLVWKNLLFRKRQFVVTGFEIALPVFFASILVLFQIKDTPIRFESRTNAFFDLVPEEVRDI